MPLAHLGSLLSPALRSLSMAHFPSLALGLAETGTHQHGHIFHVLLRFGLVGLFFVSIVDSSFVPLPIPGISDLMIVFFAAQHTNLILLVSLATAGSALGGYLSFWVGQRGGKDFLEKHVPKRILGQVQHWMEHHAILAVSLPAILPPPTPLSPFVLAAGASCMSLRRFMTAFTVSRLLRHIAAAWIGVHYGKAVLSLWNRFSERWATTILIALWSVILVGVAIAGWRIYKTSKSFRGKGRPAPATSPAA